MKAILTYHGASLGQRQCSNDVPWVSNPVKGGYNLESVANNHYFFTYSILGNPRVLHLNMLSRHTALGYRECTYSNLDELICLLLRKL